MLLKYFEYLEVLHGVGYSSFSLDVVGDNLVSSLNLSFASVTKTQRPSRSFYDLKQLALGQLGCPLLGLP